MELTTCKHLKHDKEEQQHTVKPNWMENTACVLNIVFYKPVIVFMFVSVNEAVRSL